ncbi:uncharacterized protein [Cardiocondyla obscurior]|uniref:uncharacterized protein n=1 Tax=Cardiocondyla obscurior TaxID=286306 RepID=UPI0039658000
MYQRKAFDKKYKKWLESNFEIKLTDSEKKRGRPTNRDFLNSSIFTKRRKLIEIVNNYSEKEIEEAFLQSLRNAGKRKLTNVINQLLQQDDTTKNNENDPCIIPYTADEAVALIEDAKLTKYQYECIRINAAQRNANIYPLYKNLSFAKKECYPESIIITEKGASVDLQSLINHTTKRLIKQPNILLPPISNRIIELELILKWGCDGSSDQSEYKQKFEDSKVTDEAIFTISMVPLCLKDMSTNEDIWKNPQPAATKYCRPIKFEFAKETKEKTLLEVK